MGSVCRPNTPPQPGDTKAVRRPGDIREPSLPHHDQHDRGCGKPLHGVGEVGIGLTNAGEARSDGGQNATKIEGIEVADQSARLAEVEDTDLAAGGKGPEELGESRLIIGEIAESEGGDDEVERPIGYGEMESVRLDDGGRLPCKLLPGSGQHGRREIAGDHRLARVRTPTQKGPRHVTGPAADIQNPGRRANQDMPKAAGCTPPPEPVDIAGEDVVQQVIARSNTVEHLPDGTRGSRLVACSLRTGTCCVAYISQRSAYRSTKDGAGAWIRETSPPAVNRRFPGCVHCCEPIACEAWDSMVKFLLWCLLFILCWPLALLALIAYPIVWILLLPFRLVGIAVGGALELVGAIITLPARLLRAI